jgi:predicted MPP superfamily phosphohydrolase
MWSRLLVISFLYVLFDIYCFTVVRTITTGMSEAWQRFLPGMYIFLSVLGYLLILGMLLGFINDQTKFLQTYGRTYLIILLVSKFFMLPFLLIDDLRRGVLWVVNQFSTTPAFDTSRSKFLSSLAAVAGVGTGMSFLWGSVRNAYYYQLKRVDIPFAGLHPDLDGFKIVQISDIHSGSFVFEHPIQNGINMILAEKPDLIVFTGDLVNYKATEIEPFFDMFGQLAQAGYPVYSILGNHDYGDYVHWNSMEEKAANLQKLIDAHGKLGWKILLNENATFIHRRASIGIMGVENFSAMRQFSKYGDLSKAVQGLGPVDFRLLLSHDPSHWDYEVNNKYTDINLTLSGHTHGFQFGINIPGWIRWSPAQLVYKRWIGLYRKANQYLYVNPGFGFLAYAGRVGFKPEITSIVLKNA